MLLTAVEPSFLFVYDTDLGLWTETKLDSQVSPHSLEAMNVILLQDGILAYIGSRSKFGLYETELKRTREVIPEYSWTSLPRATVLATLGLCLNIPKSGTPGMVFYGSPRTLMLSHMIELEFDVDWYGLEEEGKLKEYTLTPEMRGQPQHTHLVILREQELQTAMSDYMFWRSCQDTVGLYATLARQVADRTYARLHAYHSHFKAII